MVSVIIVVPGFFVLCGVMLLVTMATIVAWLYVVCDMCAVILLLPWQPSLRVVCYALGKESFS